MDPPTNRDDLIQNFCNLTQATPAEAVSALESCNWSIEAAVQSWFTSQDDDDDDDVDPNDDPDADYDSDEQYLQKTLTKPIPTTSSSNLPSTGAASTSRNPQTGSGSLQGGVRTLRDIGGPAQDEDDSDEKDQDYFAGGEKSGLAVQGGGPAGAQDHIQGILNRARRNLPRPGGDDEPTRYNFAGQGVTLGGDDTPSRVIPDLNSLDSGSQPLRRVRRTLHLWQDGFSVDDGDLYRYDDPANRETLAMIQSGRAPIHLLNVSSGQEVDLELDVRKEDKYVKSKPKYKPFGGQGQRLGSEVPGIESSTSSASVPVQAPASSTPTTSSSGPPQVSIDESTPAISLQIRLGDGTRLQSRFNTTHTIGDIYEFVNRASPASNSRSWALMTTFPSKELDDKSVALGDLAEFKRGGVVVQKWK